MVKAKKHLGQHFLTDKNIARKIVNSLNPNTKALLEVGPGTGILTKIILEKNITPFFAIELDSESVEYLKTGILKEEQIIQADFLKYDLNVLFGNKPFSITGNFPYNISGRILFKVLEYREQLEEVVGMFQKEVVQRITAKSGTKQYGILSVLLQTYFEAEHLFNVSPGVFLPPPKVQSAVLRLRRKDHLPDIPFQQLKTLVKAAFNQRRKTLRNALKPFRFHPSERLVSLMNMRAEQLSCEDFIFLAGQILS